MKLAPSILSANFLKLEEEIKKIDIDEVNYIHIDVMDGHFVPNLTIGPNLVKHIKKCTKKLLDVHIMVDNPEIAYEWFIEAGADLLTFHIEATKHPERLLQRIKSFNLKAGIALNPATSIDSIKYIVGAFDVLMLMAVNPGFGGQKFMPAVLGKVTEALSYKAKANFEIELDGGVNFDNIKTIKNKGVDIIVAGYAVFGEKDPAAAVRNLILKANS